MSDKEDIKELTLKLLTAIVEENYSFLVIMDSIASCLTNLAISFEDNYHNQNQLLRDIANSIKESLDSINISEDGVYGDFLEEKEEDGTGEHLQ